MNVVFLDVDGVLNHENFLRVLDEQHRQLQHTRGGKECDCYILENQIDKASIARLNRLLEATGAKVVISSSWRKLLDPPELERVLVKHGFAGEIIGETPDGPNDPVFTAGGIMIDRIHRGHEIAHWLSQHPEVERFVILDDCSDMEHLKHRLVQTDVDVGLTDEDVELAIRMMSWSGKL